MIGCRHANVAAKFKYFTRCNPRERTRPWKGKLLRRQSNLAAVFFLLQISPNLRLYVDFILNRVAVAFGVNTQLAASLPALVVFCEVVEIFVCFRLLM